MIKALCVLLLGCSAAAVPADLRHAEALEHGGDDALALSAYTAAETTCGEPRWCGPAYLGRAATLERLHRDDEAAAAYEAVPARVGPRGAASVSAGALVSAARLHLARGRGARAYDLWWRVLLEYPDEAAADDALRHVMLDGRRRNPRQLYGALIDLFARLEKTEVADNLLWALATLAREDLGDPVTAIASMDRLRVEFPRSGFRDDAAWIAGQLARARGDFAGAAARWRSLLATREEAWLMGSYHTIYLDDAQLELGRLLRDNLGQPREALVEFAKMEKDYPRSTLLDDALYEIAATRAALGDGAAACDALHELHKRFPESSVLVEKAPALAGKLGCKPR